MVLEDRQWLMTNCKVLERLVLLGGAISWAPKTAPLMKDYLDQVTNLRAVGIEIFDERDLFKMFQRNVNTLREVDQEFSEELSDAPPDRPNMKELRRLKIERDCETIEWTDSEIMKLIQSLPRLEHLHTVGFQSTVQFGVQLREFLQRFNNRLKKSK